MSRPWAKTATQPCGTHAGYRRHQRRKESVCEPCREARRKYMRDRYSGVKTEMERARLIAFETLAARHDHEFRELYRFALVQVQRRARDTA